MTPRDFCYWLQGYFEINQMDAALRPEQILVIQQHLQLVLKNQTGSIDFAQYSSKLVTDDEVRFC